MRASRSVAEPDSGVWPRFHVCLSGQRWSLPAVDCYLWLLSFVFCCRWLISGMRGASCTKWCLWAIGVCSWLASAAGARPFTQHLDQRGLLPSRCRFISCVGHLASVGSHAQLRSRSRRRQLRETELGGQRLNIWRECYIRGFI